MREMQAIFIDRDGTIGGSGYFEHPRNFILYDGAQDAILALKEAGLKVFAFTNQHWVSEGKATVDEFRQQFADFGFDDAFIRPHPIDKGCDCRKPQPGMLLQAAEKHGLDLSKCVVIGDTGEADMNAAHAASAMKIIVRTGRGEEFLNEQRHTWEEVDPDYIADDFNEAVDWILEVKL